MTKSEVEKLEAEHALLIGAVSAVKEFHEARTQLDNTIYKYDFGKIVTEKRLAMDAALAVVEPIMRAAGAIGQ